MVPLEITDHPDVTDVIQYDAFVTATAFGPMVFKVRAIIFNFGSYFVRRVMIYVFNIPKYQGIPG